MTDTLDAHLRDLVRDACREAVADALEAGDLPEPPAEPTEDGWRSRLWAVEPDTRLSLADAAEALGVSERSVRRYLDGNGERPPLPSRKGPTGLTIRAGDLRTWISDVEDGNRFRHEGAA